MAILKIIKKILNDLNLAYLALDANKVTAPTNALATELPKIKIDAEIAVILGWVNEENANHYTLIYNALHE